MVSWSCWILLLLCIAARFFGWLGLSTPPEELETPLCIPFEMATGDNHFQAEAMHWDLSPPDSYCRQLCWQHPWVLSRNQHECCCHVMVQVHSSHADLREEEEVAVAAKLGVDLFNCQANAEGHRMYPCTPELEELQEQPTGCRWSRLEMPIHRSLQQPVLDETLIASGQHWVAQLVEDITQQMGNVSSCGGAGLREGHRVVLSDLHHEQERARDVYSQLESDLALLLAQQHRMEEVMEKLQQVNRSLGLILATVEGARNHLENLHAVLHPAGQSPSAISTFILHGSYFALLVALLVPTPPRAILLLTFSVLGELLGIPALSTLLVLAVAGQLLVVAARCGAGGAWLMFPQEEPHHQLTSTPDRECRMELLQEELDRMEMSCLQEPSYLEQPPVMAGDTPCLAGHVSPVPSSWRTKLSSCGVMQEPPVGAGKCWEPKPCSPSQSLASNMSSLSPRCQGLTRARQRCRKKAIPGQDFCHVHTTGRTSCSGLAMDSSPHI